MKPKEIRQEDFLFVLLLVFTVLESLSKYRGVGVSDAGNYIYAAHDLCNGRIPVIQNFYANRIGTTVLFAAGMKFFSLSILQLTYVSTVVLILLQIFVYRVVSVYNRVIALFAVSLLGLSNIMLTSATSVMSDMPSTLMSNAPVLVYFWFTTRWSNGDLKQTKLPGLVAGLLFVAALLTKESVVFFLPLLVYLAYRDRNTEKMVFWRMMAVTIFAGAVIIGAWYAWKTGNPFYRLEAVNSGCSQSDCNYAHAPWQLILKRISFQPLQFLIEDYGFGLLFFLSVLNFCRKSRSAEVSFFKIYLVFTLGMWWVGPQGLPWNPVALAHRLWLPIMVPLAINAAIILYDVVYGKLSPTEKKRLSGMAVIGIVVIGIVLYHLHVAYAAVNEPDSFLPMGLAYAVVAVLLVAALLLPDGAIPEYLPAPQKLLLPVLIVTLIGFLGLQYTGAVVADLLHLTKTPAGINTGEEYKAERAAVLYVEAQHPNCILTDYNLSKRYHVYDNFGPDYPFKAWFYADSNSIPQSAYLLINKDRLDFSRRNITETLIYTRPNGSDSNCIVPAYAYNPKHYGFVLVKATDTHEVWEKE